MNINYVFRHMEATDAIKDHVSAKLERIKKYLIHGVDAHVVLSVEKFRHQCEIQIHEKDFQASALEVSDNLYASIDAVVHKIETQLKKHKERVKKHNGREFQEHKLSHGELDISENP